MEILIDSTGEIWPVDGEEVAQAVSRFGQIHISVRGVPLVEVELHPERISSAATAEALRLIDSLDPERVLLKVDCKEGDGEEFRELDALAEKIEGFAREFEQPGGVRST